MEQVLSRRERKKLETRQRLLESALTLLREKGYSATTIEDITQQADVAKGTFFNYFASKEALLDELSVWRVEQLRAVLDVNKGAPASPMARLKLLMRITYEDMTEDMRLFRRAWATRLSNPPPPPHRARRHLFGFLDELTAEAQACGEMRADVDERLVSDLVRMVFFRQMAVRHHIEDCEPPTAEHFEHILDLLMDGLAGPTWRDRSSQ